MSDAGVTAPSHIPPPLPAYQVRAVMPADEPHLWQMLYYAAHMDDDGAIVPEAAIENPFLAQYVAEWGRPGDLGMLAEVEEGNVVIGAAWVRLLTADESSVSYHDDETPELAVAVSPAWMGRGVGSALIQRLVAEAIGRYPAIVLTVRADNQAVRLYERFGFVVIDEIVNRVGTKSYKMLLTLEAHA